MSMVSCCWYTSWKLTIGHNNFGNGYFKKALFLRFFFELLGFLLEALFTKEIPI